LLTEVVRQARAVAGQGRVDGRLLRLQPPQGLPALPPHPTAPHPTPFTPHHHHIPTPTPTPTAQRHKGKDKGGRLCVRENGR
jgi:hypothetical protein